MLSVFSTPCTKPKACHCANSLPVRWLTSLRKAKYLSGCPASAHSRQYLKLKVFKCRDALMGAWWGLLQCGRQGKRQGCLADHNVRCVGQVSVTPCI